MAPRDDEDSGRSGGSEGPSSTELFSERRASADDGSQEGDLSKQDLSRLRLLPSYLRRTLRPPDSSSGVLDMKNSTPKGIAQLVETETGAIQPMSSPRNHSAFSLFFGGGTSSSTENMSGASLSADGQRPSGEVEGMRTSVSIATNVSTAGTDKDSLDTSSLLMRRERFKRPLRGIARWVPVVFFIANDIINGSFVTLPYLMNLHGWIGGLVLLWFLSGINYYCCHLLFRFQRIFPGAVTMGDLAYYVTRSRLAMGVTFFLAYGLMFLTTTQQMAMAAVVFQDATWSEDVSVLDRLGFHAHRRVKIPTDTFVCIPVPPPCPLPHRISVRVPLINSQYYFKRPLWLLMMSVLILPLAQMRTVKSVLFVNVFNLSGESRAAQLDCFGCSSPTQQLTITHGRMPSCTRALQPSSDSGSSPLP